MGNMDASTLMFFIFWGLFFVAAAILLTVRGLLGRKRRKAEAAAHEAFIAQQRADRADAFALVAPDLDAPAASTFATVEPEPVAPPIPSEASFVAQAGLPEAPSQHRPQPDFGFTNAGYGDRYASWEPRDLPAWTPPVSTQQSGSSWTTQELFRINESDFEDPKHIPVLTPAQVPNVGNDDYVFGPMTASMATMLPLTDRKRVERELKEAGYYQPHAVQNLTAVRFVLMFVTMAFFGGLLLLVPPVAEIPVAILALAIPALLWAVPRVVV